MSNLTFNHTATEQPKNQWDMFACVVIGRGYKGFNGAEEKKG